MPSRLRFVLSAGAIGLAVATPALLIAAEPDIGVFTAVEGKVSVQHAQSAEALAAKQSDTVLFRDLIETQKESRTKALLNDDSILTVGEHSRVEITEHIYDPNRGVRSVVVNLVQGKVRALVGKIFEGSGSKFEIHTPTAVAAARGTYFVVWHVDGVSGIANVGSHGNVDFGSAGRTVNVGPGSFSLTPPGGGPPALPSPMTGSNVPAQVTAAVQGTEVPSTPASENPSHTAAASGGTAPVQSPQAIANVSGATSGTTTTTSSSGTTSSLVTGSTPPAVTSGAAPGSSGDGGGTGETGGGSGDTGGGGGDTGGGGGGEGPKPNRGLHLGQLGLQPGFGFPTPGNNIIPPAVVSGAAGRGPSFTPPGRGGTPPGRGGTPPGNGPPGGNGPPEGNGHGPQGGNGPKK
ncbi:MAG TPA: FecR family protein [Nitrospiraceae bacterium]